MFKPSVNVGRKLKTMESIYYFHLHLWGINSGTALLHVTLGYSSYIVYLLTLSLRDSHIYFGIISSESIAFGPSSICLDIDSVLFCL